jgi:hypothetical protein
MSIRNVYVPMMLLLSATAYSADTTGNRSAPLGSKWADAEKMPDLFSGMWMTFSAMVEADAKLNVPYTAKAQQHVDTYKFKRDIPYAEDGCQTPGLPIGMRAGPLKFTYAPGLISIYMQSVGDTRFIKMNEKLGKTSPKYYGNSVGHWEGDTLVIETRDFLPDVTFQYGVGKGLPDSETFGPGGPPRRGPAGGPPGGAPPGGLPPGGFPPGGGPPGGLPPGGGGPPGGGPPPDIAGALSHAIWGPHGDGMHMLERMRLVDPNTMELALTLYDDTVWTKPYVTATRKYTHIQKGISEVGPFSGEPEEWVCTVSVTSFDPATNAYVDKDPEEMVKFLDKKAGK